jgi:hypothetical protein
MSTVRPRDPSRLARSRLTVATGRRKGSSISWENRTLAKLRLMQ